MFPSKRALLIFILLLIVPAGLAAQAQAGELAGALHWRSVGPFTGGRVTTLAGISAQPNVFFMGTAGGGVWETTNYGNSWKNITDKDLKVGSIGAMAIAPSNPKVMYVGTGDSAPRNTVTTGEGMYKSVDGGKTWTFAGLGDTHIISWILVDPSNPDVVYAAALGHLFGPNPERGVFKTVDGGQSWKKILFVDDNTGAITMAMDPANPQVVYAGMWQISRQHWGFSSGGPGSGIYKTTDGGATWTNLTHAPGLPTGIFGKVGLAVAPSEPNVVYALIQAEVQGQAGGLFRSDDAGQTWKLISLSQDITQRAFYYGRVYADPKDANTIYLPNVGVYVSHDAGKTLIALHPPHGDNHAFWVNPDDPRILVEGNDGGATVSRDGGQTWSSEDNQPTGQFYHANLDDQFPFHIYGAQQDRSSVEGVSSGAMTPVWTTVRGGEMSWVVPTPGQPWITYASGYYSDEWRDNRRTGVSELVSAWPAFKFGAGGKDLKYRFGWNHHAAVFNPRNPSEFLMGAQVVLETQDQGVHWKAISPDLTRNDRSKQERPGGLISKDVTGEEMFDTISSLAFSPLDSSILWSGSDDGLVYVSRNGGAHWTPVRPPQLPTWSTVTCIEPSHIHPGTAYLSASRFDWDDFHPYMYKTTDYGKTWTDMTAGLPQNEYVESVRQDPNDADLLLAATSRTVYYSLDGGRQWKPLTLNLPAVRVNDIEIQPQQHAVVVATFGRAFWVLDDLQYLEQLGTARVTGDVAYLFKPQQAWLTSGGGGFGGGRGGAGAENKPAGLTVLFHLPSNYANPAPVKLTFSDAGGRVIDSFTLPQQPAPRLPESAGGGGRGPAAPRLLRLHPGVNRFQWNLRFPDATEVKGIYRYTQQNGELVGPEVVPGTYTVTLTCGSFTQKQPFVVKLDPSLPTTQAELQRRFELLMRLHQATDRLDNNLNRAIDARDALRNSGADSGAHAAAHAVLDALNRDINGLVDLQIQSGEGSLVYPDYLRSWLWRISNRIGSSLLPPTAGMVGVANDYIHQANAGVARLQSDVAAAQRSGQP